MSDASTVQLIEAYMEEAPAPQFLSGLFQSPPRNFHNSEKVEIDIERDDQDVAIVVHDMTSGARKNESSQYTSKAFTPPVFKEESTLDGFELIKRSPGESPYVDPNYQANAMARSFSVFHKLDRKIRRAVELMGSQVLQTGILSLTDSAGNVLYTLDFGMKSAHKAASSADWSASLSAIVPLTDIDARARLLRQNGKRTPDRLIFGRIAWNNFLHNTYVRSELDNRRIEHGKLDGMGFSITRDLSRGNVPTPRGEGANMEGWMTIGPFRFELWTYDAEYRDPVTDNMTPYIAADKVIMMSSQSRLDLSYGNIPFPVPPESRALPFLPGRMSSSERGLDIITNAYVAPDNTGVTVGAYARPLTIPTAIDTLGCIDTES